MWILFYSFMLIPIYFSYSELLRIICPINIQYDRKFRVLILFFNFFFQFTFFLTIYQKKTFQLLNTALFSKNMSIFRCFLWFWPPSHKTRIFLELVLNSAWKMLHAYCFFFNFFTLYSVLIKESKKIIKSKKKSYSRKYSTSRCFLWFWPPSHRTRIFLALDLNSSWKILYAYFLSHWNSLFSILGRLYMEIDTWKFSWISLKIPKICQISSNPSRKRKIIIKIHFSI